MTWCKIFTASACRRCRVDLLFWYHKTTVQLKIIKKNHSITAYHYVRMSLFPSNYFSSLQSKRHYVYRRCGLRGAGDLLLTLRCQATWRQCDVSLWRARRHISCVLLTNRRNSTSSSSRVVPARFLCTSTMIDGWKNLQSVLHLLPRVQCHGNTITGLVKL